MSLYPIFVPIFPKNAILMIMTAIGSRYRAYLSPPNHDRIEADIPCERRHRPKRPGVVAGNKRGKLFPVNTARSLVLRKHGVECL
jgi:hypothetical protein